MSPLLGMGCTSECFQDEGKDWVLRQRRNSLASTGANSDAHSLRTLAGMPSGPLALLTSSFERTRWTLREEIIGLGIGLERTREGGGIAAESSKVELEENKEPKRLAFSVGVLAIELSVRKRGGKEDLQKLLEIFLARDQKDLVVVELVKPAHFL